MGWRVRAQGVEMLRPKLTEAAVSLGIGLWRRGWAGEGAARGLVLSLHGLPAGVALLFFLLGQLPPGPPFLPVSAAHVPLSSSFFSPSPVAHRTDGPTGS